MKVKVRHALEVQGSPVDIASYIGGLDLPSNAMLISVEPTWQIELYDSDEIPARYWLFTFEWEEER